MQHVRYTLLAFLLPILGGFGNLLSAQTANDLTISVTTVNSSCRQNGSVTITVASKNAALYPIRKTVYGLIDQANGQSMLLSGDWVEQNTITNLPPGNYKAKAKVEFANNSIVEIEKPDIVVLSTWTQGILSIAMSRKSLNNFPSGQITLQVNGGTPPYSAVMTTHPASYTGPTTFPLAKGVPIKIDNLPAGDYVVQASDLCGTYDQSVTRVEAVTSDLPPAGERWTTGYLHGSEWIRENACGWLSVNLYETTGYAARELYPYFADKALLSRYYEFALQTKEDSDAGLPKTYFTAENAPYPPGLSAGEIASARKPNKFYYQLPAGQTYSVFLNPDRIPRLFMRVRGTNQDALISNNPPIFYQGAHAAFIIPTPLIRKNCAAPSFSARVSTDNNHLFCYPVHYVLKEKVTGTIVSEGDFTSTVRQKEFENLEIGKTYLFTHTSADGQTKTTEKTYVPPKLIGTISRARIHCPVPEFSIELDLKSGFERIPLEAGSKVRFVSAPAGFTPPPGSMSVGDEFVLTKQIWTFYPFTPGSDYGGPADGVVHGEYVFSVTDVCGEVYTVKLNHTSPPTQIEIATPKADVVLASCNHIRIYPFRGDMALFKRNGATETYYAFIATRSDGAGSLPAGLSAGQIYNSQTAGMAYLSLQANPATPEVNKDLYFEIPRMSGKITLVYGSSALSYLGLTLPLDPKYSCFPVLEVDFSGSYLSYDRETLYSYRCPDGLSGVLHVDPVNLLGDCRVDLIDLESGATVQTQTVAKGQPCDFTLAGTAANPVKERYRLKLTDLQCLSTIEEVVTIYSLDSPDILRFKGDKKSFCIGDDLEVSCVLLGAEDKMTYTWTGPGGLVQPGRTLRLSNLTTARNGIYTLTITGLVCGGAPINFTRDLPVSVSPTQLYWSFSPVDGNWNDSRNWLTKTGIAANVVPSECSDVYIYMEPAVRGTVSGQTIPSVLPSFPDLDPGITLRNPLGNPVCRDIYFLYGSELGNPHFLTYRRAFVDYSLGFRQMKWDDAAGGMVSFVGPDIFLNGRADMLARDRWYMLATPLKKVVSGDFGLAGYPKTYRRRLGTSTFSAGTLVNADFSAAFGSQVDLLSKGHDTDAANENNAVALKVAGMNADKVGYRDHKYLDGLRGHITLPFFQDADRAIRYPLHKYVGGESRFRYYHEETLAPLSREDKIARGEEAYRFVFEQSATKAVGAIGHAPYTTTPGYFMRLNPADNAAGLVMVGNPFMTSINFDKLYEANKTAIENVYYVFINGVWKSYGIGLGAANSLTSKIPPRQAFAIRLKGSPAGISFPVEGPENVLNPASLFKYGAANGTVLHPQSGALRAGMPDAFYAEASSADGDAGDYSRAVLLHDAAWGTSAPALVNNDCHTAPTVFFVDRKGFYNAIEVEDTNRGRIPMGVFFDRTTTVRLDFGGIASGNYEELVLVDKVAGKELNLLLTPAYSYLHEGAGSSAAAVPRFELRIKRHGVENDPDEGANAAVSVDIRQADELISVTANRPIVRIMLYDMGGRTVADEQVGGSSAHRFDAPPRGTYIARLTLASGDVVTRKLSVD